MKKEFQIYKEGVTDDKVWIVSSPEMPFNRAEKIRKFIALGYKVYDIDGVEIIIL